MTLLKVPQPAPLVVTYRPESSSISVTRAAIWDRSERTRVTCANSGWPLSFSITAMTPSCQADPQVVALRDVVGEDHPGSGADPGQHGEQDAPLEGLRLVHDHERVVQRPASDVGEREHLEHVPGQHLVDDVLRGDRGEGVVHGLGPRAHLVGLGSGQVPEFLAADRVQRPEHDDLAVLPAFHHGLEPGAQRERGLAGAGPAAERHDADLRVEEQVERDALLGAPAPQPERLAVAPDQLDGLVWPDPAERAAVRRGQDQPGVAGKVAGGLAVQGA